MDIKLRPYTLIAGIDPQSPIWEALCLSPMLYCDAPNYAEIEKFLQKNCWF